MELLMSPNYFISSPQPSFPYTLLKFMSGLAEIKTLNITHGLILISQEISADCQKKKDGEYLKTRSTLKTKRLKRKME